MGLNLSELHLSAVSLEQSSFVLSLVALGATILGIIVSARYYKRGVKREKRIDELLKEIDTKTVAIEKLHEGNFSRILEVILSLVQGGYENQNHEGQDKETVSKEIEGIEEDLTQGGKEPEIRERLDNIVSLGSDLQARICFFVAQSGKITLEELTNKIKMKQSIVSKATDRLVSKNLIKKSEEENVVHYSLKSK
mgnify:CR=1 FL=1